MVDADRSTTRILGQIDQLIAAVIMHVRKEEGKYATLRAVRQFIGSSKLRSWMDILKSSDYPPIATRARQFEFDGFESASIISNLFSQTDFLDSPALQVNLDDQDIQFSKMKRNVETVYIVLPIYESYHMKCARVILAAAVREFMREPVGGPVLIVFDELSVFPDFPEIVPIITQGRQYGIQIWMVLQHLLQLRENRDLILNNVGVLGSFRTTADTASYLSDRAASQLTPTHRIGSGGGSDNHISILQERAMKFAAYTFLYPESCNR